MAANAKAAPAPALAANMNRDADADATKAVDPIIAASSRADRLLQYSLIGGQIFSNYVPRLAIPSIVPFLVREYGFSDLQRARLLASFTPGCTFHSSLGTGSMHSVVHGML